MQLVGNGFGDFALDGEDIIDGAIVVLRPLVRIGPGIDQLRVHPHFVAGALHAAFQEMRHPELLADLAQVARGAALVLHHTGAADHFQVRHFRQRGQNLVLHAIGEKDVVRIAAHVVERKHGDAFVLSANGRRHRLSHSIEHEQRDGEREHPNDQEVELASGGARDRLVRRDFIRAFDALRRDLESPGEN